MKKIKHLKLSLTTETLRVLASSDLEAALGGATTTSPTSSLTRCNSCASCPVTGTTADC
jgi:hypothetical protein